MNRPSTTAAVGVLLTVVTLVVGLVVTLDAHSSSRPPRQPKVRVSAPLPDRPFAANAVVDLRLFGPQRAVVLTAHRLLFTTNEGRTWRNGAPPQRALASAAISFANESQGWLAVPSLLSPPTGEGALSPPKTGIRINLYETTNAGHQWQQQPSPPVVYLPPGQVMLVPLFTQGLVDHLVVASAESQGNTAGALLTSVDAGAHWQVPTPLPAGGAVTFATREVAWMAQGDRIFVTRNAGATWQQRVLLPLVTPALTAGELWGHPLLVSATTWVLPVRQAPAGSGPSRTSFAITSDAGQHWRVATAPLSGAPAAVSASQWLVVTPKGLETSRDAGRTWALIRARWHADATFGGAAAGAMVVSLRVSASWWAVAQAEQCTQGRPCRSLESLFVSADHGHTWAPALG